MRPAVELTYSAETTHSDRSPNVRAVNRLFGLGRTGTTVPILEDVPVPPEGLVLITGPSGAGKSTLLRLVRECWPDAAACELPDNPDTPLIDLFGSDFATSIAWLGRFGLGEARLMTTPFRHLSDGQKARSMLALGTWRRPDRLIVDEFLSVLDRTNARLVAFNFQKLCRSAGITACVATSHDDLIEALAPDFIIRLELGASHRLENGALNSSPMLPELAEVEIRDGEVADFRELSRFHYVEHLASEGPLGDLEWRQLVSRVRTARYRGQTVGVVVFSRPFPQLLETIPFFRLVNKRVAVVLRIITHPTFRGAGITKALLEPPQTPDLCAVLACSALGIHFPFFLGAGFRATEHPRCLRYPEHDQLDALLGQCTDELLEDLHEYSEAQIYYDALPPEARSELRRVVTDICVRMNVDYGLFLGGIAGIDVTQESDSLGRIFRHLTAKVPEQAFGTMLSEAIYFPAAGFVRNLS